MGVTSTRGMPATCKPIGGTTMSTVAELEVVETLEVEVQSLSIDELDMIAGGAVIASFY
jgi:hypothetical protein